jgi:ankyrin repeat protein
VRIPGPSLAPFGFGAKGTKGTPIHIAAHACDLALIKRLLRRGYGINAIDSCGVTAAQHLSRNPLRDRRQGLLGALCKLGADVNHRIEANWDRKHSEYRWAATNSYILRRFIEGRLQADVQPAHVEVLELLIKHGASLNQALHAAGYTDSGMLFIGPLLKAGADIEEVMHDLTPLAMAAQNRSLAVARALLDVGANVNGAGQSILFTAIKPLKSVYVYAPNTARTVRVLCDAGAETT